MTIRLLLGFLPWILFYLLPFNTPNQFKFGIAGLLLLIVVTNYQELRRKFLLPWCTLLFFSGISLGVIIFDLKFLMPYLSILANGTLSGLALGSLAIDKPFTLQYARLQVTKDKWQHPAFIFINRVLTFAWSMSFLFNLSVNVLQKVYPYPHWLNSLLTNSSTLGAIFFTLWFPKWYRKQVAHKHQ